MCRLLIALLLSLIIAKVGTGQEIRVHARDSLTGAAVARALVTARNDSGGQVAHALTNDAGQVTIRLPVAGRWVVSVRRIGLEPRVGAVRLVRNGEVVSVAIDMRSMSFSLPATRVVAASGSCSRADDRHDRTSMLWEQVTLALRSSTTAERNRTSDVSLRAATYDRDLDRALTVVNESPVQIRRGLGRPFAAAHPDSLAVHGYVRSDANRTLQYFAPDENALLSESFAATHCFDTPDVDENPALAELRFRPSPSQRQPDITGTAYVDAASGALQRIVFKFVNADSLFPAGTAHAGGDVRFDQLPDGNWIVTSWSIRMPRMVRVAWARGPRLTGYHEVGGAVEALNATFVAHTIGETAHPGGVSRQSSGPPPRATDRATSRASGDQVIVGGKLIVATSAAARTARDWRRTFGERRRFGIGVFLDSTQWESSAPATAVELLRRFEGVSLFVVPDGVPAPPRDDDVDLAEGWTTGAFLPVIASAGASGASATCLLKLFLDGERVGAAALRRTSGAEIGAMELYAKPRDVPDGFRRSGNQCGTVLLWSRNGRTEVP